MCSRQKTSLIYCRKDSAELLCLLFVAIVGSPLGFDRSGDSQLNPIQYALFTMHTVKKASSRWFSPDVLSGLGLSGVGIAMVVKGYKSIPQN